MHRTIAGLCVIWIPGVVKGEHVEEVDLVVHFFTQVLEILAVVRFIVKEDVSVGAPGAEPVPLRRRPVTGRLGLLLWNIHAVLLALVLNLGCALLLWHLFTAVLVLSAALLGRNLLTLSLVPALFHWNSLALLLRCAIARGGVVRGLRFATLQLVRSFALLLVIALIGIHGLAVLLGHLLALVHVEGATFFPRDFVASLLGALNVDRLPVFPTLLALLPLYVAVLLDVHLPALHGRNKETGFLRVIPTVDFLVLPALSFRDLHAVLGFLTILFGHILTLLLEGGGTQLVRDLLALLFDRYLAFLLRDVVTLLCELGLALLLGHVGALVDPDLPALVLVPAVLLRCGLTVLAVGVGGLARLLIGRLTFLNGNNN